MPRGTPGEFWETSFSLCDLTPVLRFSLVVHTLARGVVHLFCSGGDSWKECYRRWDWAQDQTLLVPELEPELSPKKAVQVVSWSSVLRGLSSPAWHGVGANPIGQVTLA